MQGVASLGYEVQELPMVPSGGIETYQKAAEMLKEFGRNGDTYIVHAAEGETMVPMEVLEANPRLKRMLWKQLEEMGVEPERYVVGNELNSLNPITGQPEFFFKKIKKAIKKVTAPVVKAVDAVSSVIPDPVKDVIKTAAPIVLPIVAPMLLPAMPLVFAAGIGSLAGNLLAGKSFTSSLKNAVITGGLAGLGNMAFGGEALGSGSFFGSKANPMGGLGEFSFSQAITPMNPLSSSYNAQVAALRATGASAEQAQQAAAALGKTEISKSLGDIDQTAGSLLDNPPESDSLFTNLKKTITPGDDYGPGEFYDQYLSPSRASIQPTNEQLAARANEIATTEIAKQQGVNQALVAAGEKPFPIDTNAITKTAMAQATKDLAPGTIKQFGNLVLAGGAGALAADAATGGQVLGVMGSQEQPASILDGPDGYALYRGAPTQYGFDENFFGDNPYYQDRRYLPPAVRDNYAASNVGTNTSSIAQTVNQNLIDQIAMLDGVSATPFESALGNYNARYLYPQMAATRAASGGEIVGPGTPTSDSIPALLSDGEFVMNARAVRGAGDGDRAAGAKRMYAMMRNFERRA